jgi:hypothetical protein
MAQEALRMKIEGERLLEDLHAIGVELMKPDTTDVARLKAAGELKLSLLRKVLPDLRSVELTGEGGGDIELNVKTGLAPIYGIQPPPEA